MGCNREWICNLPSLGGSAFCRFYRLEVPEQALDGIPLGFGIDKPSKLSFIYQGCLLDNKPFILETKPALACLNLLVQCRVVVLKVASQLLRSMSILVQEAVGKHNQLVRNHFLPVQLACPSQKEEEEEGEELEVVRDPTPNRRTHHLPRTRIIGRPNNPNSQAR